MSGMFHSGWSSYACAKQTPNIRHRVKSLTPISQLSFDNRLWLRRESSGLQIAAKGGDGSKLTGAPDSCSQRTSSERDG